MKPLSVNLKFAAIDKDQVEAMLPHAMKAKATLEQKTGRGNDFLGWLDYSDDISEDLIKDIQETADSIRKDADVLLVVGIGGSYLGAKSAIEALRVPFYNEKSKDAANGPKVYFIGHHLGANYMRALLEHVQDMSVYVNVISKSGTTTEPAVAFRLVKAFMDKKYGAQAKSRIIATTDEKRGALKSLADQETYKTFVIPDDVGGRFSVFTPVGLLPIAVSGIDIVSLLTGARQASKDTSSDLYAENPALQYAVARNILYANGKKTEILVNYEPAIKDVAEWWKQLFGESEGKEGKGILPHAMSFTTDLHSLGQYVQEGERTLFETVLNIVEDTCPLNVPEDAQNADGLNFLCDKSLAQINDFAMKGTLLAHVEGGVPNIIVDLKQLDAYHLGYCYFFFMKACGISGYMLDVNPFDQPGVEAYKKNMFGLLGKPGFEALGADLKQKLNQ